MYRCLSEFSGFFMVEEDCRTFRMFPAQVATVTVNRCGNPRTTQLFVFTFTVLRNSLALQSLGCFSAMANQNISMNSNSWSFFTLSFRFFYCSFLLQWIFLGDGGYEFTTRASLNVPMDSIFIVVPNRRTEKNFNLPAISVQLIIPIPRGSDLPPIAKQFNSAFGVHNKLFNSSQKQGKALFQSLCSTTLFLLFQFVVALFLHGAWSRRMICGVSAGNNTNIKVRLEVTHCVLLKKL